MASSRITHARRHTLPEELDAAKTEGNARLTALTGLVVLSLVAGQLVTVVLGVRHVLTAHAVIGLLLVPPILLKISSVVWRAVGYYRHDPNYRSAGAPRPILRVLGPLLVLLTVLLMASGILAFLGPQSFRGGALTLHRTSAYLWLVALALHVVPHFLHAVRLAAADLTRRHRARLPGAAARLTALACAVAFGALFAAALSGHAGPYLSLYPHR